MTQKGGFESIQDLWLEDQEKLQIAKVISQQGEQIVYEELKSDDKDDKSLDSIDFYDSEFQNMLREFCHVYQIPFLESNIPKTARNAAKIYFRLV